MSDFKERWHQVVFERDFDALDRLLAAEVAFHSPFVWKPKLGKQAARFILTNVIDVFEDFTYHRVFQNGPDWCLEFSATVNELKLKGVDLVHLNEQGQIDHFEVMVRPANALQALGAEMGRRLASAGLT